MINMLKSLQIVLRKVSRYFIQRYFSDVFKELKQLGIPKINMNVINKDEVSYVECFLDWLFIIKIKSLLFQLF